MIIITWFLSTLFFSIIGAVVAGISAASDIRKAIVPQTVGGKEQWSPESLSAKKYLEPSSVSCTGGSRYF
jgi:hypothetical protein